jgi:hypothetical protein
LFSSSNNTSKISEFGVKPEFENKALKHSSFVTLAGALASVLLSFCLEMKVMTSRLV